MIRPIFGMPGKPSRWFRNSGLVISEARFGRAGTKEPGCKFIRAHLLSDRDYWGRALLGTTLVLCYRQAGRIMTVNEVADRVEHRGTVDRHP
jgi:hypothetical protein